MRTPREGVLPKSERLRILPLDVTKPESIAAALEASGPIDVLVNNAGIGMIGALEGTPMARARQIFETNTFGVMAMTQAVLPQFRAAQPAAADVAEAVWRAANDISGSGTIRRVLTRWHLALRR